MLWLASRRNCSSEKHDGPRPGAIEMHHVAGEQQRVGAFGQRRFEHLLGGEIRRFEKRLAQMGGHFGDARERALQMQIAGMNKPERGLRHRRLLAYEVQPSRRIEPHARGDSIANAAV